MILGPNSKLSEAFLLTIFRFKVPRMADTTLQGEDLMTEQDAVAVVGEINLNEENEDVVVVVESGTVKSVESFEDQETEKDIENTVEVAEGYEESPTQFENPNSVSPQTAIQDVDEANNAAENVEKGLALELDSQNLLELANASVAKEEISTEDKGIENGEGQDEILEQETPSPDESGLKKIEEDEVDDQTFTEANQDGGEDETVQVMIPIISGEDVNEVKEETVTEEESKSGNIDYTCEECGKKFTHLSSKKRHMLKHKCGEMPVIYQCLACSKTFNYNSSLKRHLKLHTEANGKEYVCKECNKAFMYATSLKRHLKTHSGKQIYPCPHCQRCFEYISSLKRHEKLHTVGKGFKCEICSKSFGYLSSLTRHQRIHENSFQCGKCDKKFRFLKPYIKHAQQEHGETIDPRDVSLEGMKTENGHVDENIEMEVDQNIEEDEEHSIAPKDTSCETDDAIDSVQMSVDKEESGANKDEKLTSTLHGEVLDLQAAENHPFVKFVVSQNTVNLEQLQNFHPQQQPEQSSGQETNVETPTSNVTYALVQADNNSVVDVENCTMVTEGQSYSDSSVGGIVLVELDQNNKVTERHMEGLQASNLLQLLQAVEGFAVEQTINLDENQAEPDQSYVAVQEDTSAKEENVE